MPQAWVEGTLRLVASRYRFPAIYDLADSFGGPGAWWNVGWDEELISYSARLEVDREGADPELWTPEDEEPLVVLGQRMGEFLEPEELLEAMEAEDSVLHVPAGLVEQLRADEKRHTSSLGPEQWAALRAKAAAG